MYLHIGDNVSIKSSQIIGFFDIDKTTTTKETRNFLSNSEQKGASITISEDMPKSFIVTADKKKITHRDFSLWVFEYIIVFP